MTYSAQPATSVHNTTTPPPPAPPPPPQFRALEGSVRELRQHHVPRLADLCRAKVDLASALRDACETGDVERIKRLIECGANPDTFVSDPFDPTAGTIPILAYACILGKADLVESLLRHGASPALWMMAEAFACGHDRVVKIMSQHVSIDTLDHRTGMSLLQTACHQHDAHALDRLLALGANVHTFSREGYSALILAFQGNQGNPRSQRRVMKKLLDAGADIETGHGSLTPLVVACRQNNLEAVSLLLQRGANPNAPVGDINVLALCCGPEVGVSIFAKLLDCGAWLPWHRGLELIGDGNDEVSVRKRHYFIMAWHMYVNRLPLQSRYYLP
jgi:Ankyrin repeat